MPLTTSTRSTRTIRRESKCSGLPWLGCFMPGSRARSLPPNSLEQVCAKPACFFQCVATPALPKHYVPGAAGMVLRIPRGTQCLSHVTPGGPHPRLRRAAAGRLRRRPWGKAGPSQSERCPGSRYPSNTCCTVFLSLPRLQVCRKCCWSGAPDAKRSSWLRWHVVLG